MGGEKTRFQSFSEFYPYYLEQHRDPLCCRLHFAGSVFVILLLVYFLLTLNWWVVMLLPVAGYGLAWTGHYFFEKNKPATFDYPLYSFMGDWVMFKDILTGRIKF